jgi:hypothetical protein
MSCQGAPVGHHRVLVSRLREGSSRALGLRPEPALGHRCGASLAYARPTPRAFPTLRRLGPETAARKGNASYAPRRRPAGAATELLHEPENPYWVRCFPEFWIKVKGE